MTKVNTVKKIFAIYAPKYRVVIFKSNNILLRNVFHILQNDLIDLIDLFKNYLN